MLQRASFQIEQLHATARFQVRALTPRLPRPLRTGNTTATLTQHDARYGYAAPPRRHRATPAALPWPRNTIQLAAVTDQALKRARILPTCLPHEHTVRLTLSTHPLVTLILAMRSPIINLVYVSAHHQLRFHVTALRVACELRRGARATSPRAPA